MPILSVLIDPILPVFAILALGFALGRRGAIALDEARLINRFAMTVLIPIVLFDLLAHAPWADLAPRPILLYAGTQAAIFVLGYGLARRGFGLAPGEAVILGYAGIFSNNVFYGLPIAVLIFGEAHVLPITTIVVIDSTLTFGGTMIALQVIQHGRVSPRGLWQIFTRTPALIAIFAGLAVGLAGLPVPAPVRTFLDFNGAAAAPVALFALGVVLSGTVFRPDAAVAAFVAIRVLLFPAVIALTLMAFGGPETDTRLYTFGAAGPVGAMAMSLAVLHGVPADRVAQAMVWSLLVSLITLAAIA